MPARSIYFIGLALIVAGGFVAYLQAVGKYGLTAPVVVLFLFILGIAFAALGNQSFFQKRNNSGDLFTVISSCCFFLVVYFITRLSGNPSLLKAAVYTSCFLLPVVVLRNWNLYRLAFQPTAISPWLLPVPYAKSNAISLHLNSITFTIRVASAPGGEEQDHQVTAPGVKTLGMVFSELIYEEKGSGQTVDFSDITDNSYNWVFYVRELGGLSHRQLDANLSLLDNRLKTNATVAAQRL